MKVRSMKLPCLLCAAGLLMAAAPGLPLSPSEDPRWENLDTAVRGNWWEKTYQGGGAWLEFLKVPRDEVVAFALYTVDGGTLKMTVQLYPLMPEEERVVRLEFLQEGKWLPAGEAPVYELGWSAHFRVEDWDSRVDVPYRARHGEKAVFEGLIRRNPVGQREIVVGSLSCNSSRDRGDRAAIVANLKALDPDLLFFAGDQSYDHRQHTAAWLKWGQQFREVIKDRPVVTIPDDHDIGQPNLWGEGGIEAPAVQGHDGGYFYPPTYVNMVHRCQTWHLPDAFDPSPVAQGITVYYTDYNVGGIDFAIIADRQFKSGPKGKIPQLGPRPDHINDPAYERSAIDLPGLTLLGERQLSFLNFWSADWTDTAMKCVLSQTNFAGAVHLHGSPSNRLLADLDSNGWPQTGRRKALRAMRRGLAFHLAGDQHLAVVTHHGIENHRDGPISFVNPAIVNTIYGRWWWPKDEEAGGNPVEGSPLPWTGDYEDGFGNKITMYAYANPDLELEKSPEAREPEDNYGDGFALARFDKAERTVTFECWPRFADVTDPEAEQYPGWPMTFSMQENDGRAPAAYLPQLRFQGLADPVVQVVHEGSGEILYTLRIDGRRFRPKVYQEGTYTIRWGEDRPDGGEMRGVQSVSADSRATLRLGL